MVSVVFVADIRLYRQGLENALATDTRFNVIGSAANAEEALALIIAGQPDVVVVDMAMLDALGVLRRLQAAAACKSILAVAVPNATPAVLACAESGVSAFVTRDESLESLCDALLRTARGEAYCSPSMTGSLLRHIGTLARDRAAKLPPLKLTEREHQVLDLISRGCSNKAISEVLCIEVCTVKNHVHRVLEKLGVTSRAEAAALRRTAGYTHGKAGEGPRLPGASLDDALFGGGGAVT